MPTSRLVEQEFVAHLFAPLDGPDTAAALEQVRDLWDACRSELGMTQPIVGAGLTIPALMTLAMSGVAPEDSGLASGLVNTTQQVGGAFGIAILATVAARQTGGATSSAALVEGYQAAFVLAHDPELGPRPIRVTRRR